MSEFVDYVNIKLNRQWLDKVKTGKAMSFQAGNNEGVNSIIAGVGRERSPELKTIGQQRYRVIGLAGRGGMSVVYHAYDTANDRDVAIKVLSLDLVGEESFLARFRRESELMRDLNHPHILKAYDYGQDETLVYLVMSYYGGGSLKDRLKETTSPLPLALATIAEYLSQIASGLDYAHSRGIIHRDIKPSNILVHHASENLVLSDFGIAKALSNASLSRTGTIMGTPLYMAPEQFLAGGDQRSDIYALGIVLYQMLTRQVPFRGEAIGFKHMTEPVPSLASLGFDYDSRIEAVLQKALAKQPEDRFQQAQALAEAFKAAIQEPSSDSLNNKLHLENLLAHLEAENAAETSLTSRLDGKPQDEALPGQDSLSAVAIMNSLPPVLSEATIPAAPVLPEATIPAAPISSLNSPLDQVHRIHLPAKSSEKAAVVPVNVRPYVAPPQTARPKVANPPYIPPAAQTKVTSKRPRNLRPLLGLLAGLILALTLGGAALLFFVNYDKTSLQLSPTSQTSPSARLTTAPAGLTTRSATATLAPAGSITPKAGGSPRSLKVVFTSQSNDGVQNIFGYDVQSGKLTQLTNTGRDSLPVWSPDGQTIVFQRLREDRSGWDIFKMNAAIEGGAVTKLVERAYNPAFANQSSRIVYVSELDKELYTIALDNSAPNPQQLTATNRAKFGPVFSADDSRLAFSQDDENGLRQIYIMPSKSGQTAVKITKCANLNCIWPSWSPDSKQLTFNTNDPKTDLPGEIWVINADGSNGHSIVNPANGGGRNSHPIWVADNRSSSGSRIYFNSDRGPAENARIYLAEPDGTNQQLYIRHPAKADNDAAVNDFGVAVFLPKN